MSKNRAGQFVDEKRRTSVEGLSDSDSASVESQSDERDADGMHDGGGYSESESQTESGHDDKRSDEPELKRIKRAQTRHNGIDADELVLLRENANANSVQFRKERMQLRDGPAYILPVQEHRRAIKAGRNRRNKHEMADFIDEGSESESESESDSDGYNDTDYDDIAHQMGLISEMFSVDSDKYYDALRLAAARVDSRAGMLVPGNRVVENDEEDAEIGATNGETTFEVSVERLAGRITAKEKIDLVRARYEPRERLDNFATDVDEQIRANDVPERLQVRNRAMPITDADDDHHAKEHRRESVWICARLFKLFPLLCCSQSELRQSVLNILHLLKMEHMEISFIWRYRKEYFNTASLSESHLWQIYDFDSEWAEMRARELMLRRSVKRALSAHTPSPLTAVAAVPPSSSPAAALRHILGNFEERERSTGEGEWNMKALRYVTSSLLFHHGEYFHRRRVSRSSKTNAYQRAMQAEISLRPLIFAVGLDGTKLAKNVSCDARVHDILSHTENTDGSLPYEQFVSTTFPSVQDVRAGLVQALAKQISVLPDVRHCAENLVSLNSTVSTTPTANGHRVINHAHEFFVVQSLKNVPLVLFRKGVETGPNDSKLSQWRLRYIRICQAETERLVRVEVDTACTERAFLERMYAASFDSSTPAESEVNQIRRDAIILATRRFVLASAVKTERADLLKIAREHVVAACGAALFRLATTAPFSGTMLSSEMQGVVARALHGPKSARNVNVPASFEYESSTHVITEHCELFDRVGACFIPPHGSKMGQNVMVVLSNSGEVIDHMRLGNLRNTDSLGIAVGSFLKMHMPRMVFVNTSGGMASEKLMNKLAIIIKELNMALCDEAFGGDPELGNIDSSEEYTDRAAQTHNSGAHIREYVVLSAYADDTLPSLFARSKRAMEAMSSFSESLRAAICLARHMQNPLAGICNLWEDRDSSRPGGILMSVPINEAQKYAPHAALACVYERSLVRATALAGVNINTCLHFWYAEATLQFVPGLGARKAKALLQRLRSQMSAISEASRSRFKDAGAPSRYIVCREELTDGVDKTGVILGDRVYRNCAGFIQVAPSHDVTTYDMEKHFDPLGNTRVHPESYPIVHHICDAMLGSTDTASAFGHKLARRECSSRRVIWPRIRKLLDAVRHDAACLSQLDLVSINTAMAQAQKDDTFDINRDPTFAMDSDRKGLGLNKLITISDVVKELQNPNQADSKLLHAYHQLSSERIFTLITQLPHNFLTKEPILAAVVSRPPRQEDIGTNRGRATVQLDCGLTATLYADRFDTEADFHNLVKHQIIHVIAKTIDKEGFRIEVSAKKSAISEWLSRHHTPPDHEGYWKDPEPVVQHRAKNSSVAPSVYGETVFSAFPRQEAELFRNKLRAEVVDEMTNREVGAVVFRPSSRGPSCVTGTVKFFENIFCDFLIRIDCVDNSTHTSNTVKPRTRFTVSGGTQSYGSLEELQFRYFQEVMDHAEAVVSHRKYIAGGRPVCESRCLDERRRNPGAKPYHFCVSRSHPGYFELGFVRCSTFRYVYVQPLATGIRCAGETFAGDGSSAVNALVQRFKRDSAGMLKRAVSEKAKFQAKLSRNNKGHDNTTLQSSLGLGLGMPINDSSYQPNATHGDSRHNFNY